MRPKETRDFAMCKIIERAEYYEGAARQLALKLYSSVCGHENNPCNIKPDTNRRLLACWGDGEAGIQCWLNQAEEAMKNARLQK